MSSIEEDVARPIYQKNNKSFMQFGSADAAGDSEVLDDVVYSSQIRDSSYSRSDSPLQTSHESGLQSENIVSYSLEDQLEYNKFQSQSLGSQETLQQYHETQKNKSYRREDLSDLLQSVFKLEYSDRLISHYPAWLLKSVMLHGHLYIMQHSLCFYAYMPKREDVTVKSGYLTKKSRTTSRLHRHWFILKNNLLSYYDDAADLYFPSGHIDLRHAMTAEADIDRSTSSAFGFRLVTSEQEYHLTTDTATSCNEWIKTLRKVIFRLKNDGDSVKITIPFASVLDVEASNVLHFTDTMKIRIADDFDTFAINEYFFSLRSLPAEIIAIVKEQVRLNQEPSGPETTIEDAVKSLPVFDTSKAAPLYYTSDTNENLAAWRARGTIKDENLELVARSAIDQHARSRRSLSIANPFRKKELPVPDHSPAGGAENLSEPTDASESVTRTSSMTRLLDSSIKTVGSIATSAYRVPMSVLQYPINTFLPNKSPQDAPALDEAVADSFRSRFGASDDERLLKAYKPFYVQAMPLIGDLYVSDERICFRNLTPGIKKRIAVPLSDIERAQKEKGFSFGFSGLVLTIKAHEDMFFEFSQSSERDQCVDFINGAIGNLDALEERKDARRNATQLRAELDQNEHAALEKALGDLGISDVLPNTLTECAIDVPAIMFDSPGASILAFKPVKQMRFTCLTIGSRGDVQPYVALCKGLIADGHKAKIATHEEFREFVESHGIEFVPIEGDPAELMAICVEHGMFTYSFLKEASQKFRGWIDDLLLSSWKACQDTDVLIESPSAMGGIHIAEALGVPYYRAFTMPWSKTRVYPHAFAVPDHSRGGSYNALTYIAFDHLFWKAISGQINRWRKKTLNIPATDYDKLAQHKVPFLYNFSPSVVPPARDWHEWIRVTGYWFLDGSDDKDGKKWDPPEQVVKFIAQSRAMQKRLVYIGFGSIVVSDPKALTRAVIDAVYQADVRCILVKGWSARSSPQPPSTSLNESESQSSSVRNQISGQDMASEQEAPAETNADSRDDDGQNFGDDILSLDSIPHDWLFPQMDAVCHHGGAGSLGASLRAGIPTIVKPFFGDQHFFGGRVQELGVGICLHSLTVKTLSGALNTCTSDRLIIERADKIGKQIRNENGVGVAIENIYRDLEYAKSLIKRKGSSSGSVSETSGESYDLVESRETHDDEDDADLFETKVDDNGITSSILKPLKSLKLLSPIGQRVRAMSRSRAPGIGKA